MAGLSAKTTRREFLKAASLIAVGTSLSGCRRLVGPENVLVGVSVPTLGVGTLADLVRGIKQFRLKAGIHPKVEQMVYNGSGSTQIQQIQAFALKAGPQNGLLFISTASLEAVPLIVRICERAKIYFVTYPSKPKAMHPSQSKYWVAHIAYDQAMEAASLLDALGRKSGGKGQYIVLNGDPSSANTIVEARAVADYLSSRPAITSVTQYVRNWDRSIAFNTMTSLLTRIEFPAAVWCANDNIALGALEAIEQARKPPTAISGYDAQPEMVNAILSGNATATAAAESARVGFYGMALAWKVAKGQLDPLTLPRNLREINPNSVIVTAANAIEYRRDNIERKPDFPLTDGDIFRLASPQTSADFGG